MQYYNDIITQKSFIYLQEMKKRFDFILIGGWAVFLYSKSLKSKDIDIIIDYEVLSKLKDEGELVKNERLHKYEINEGNFDIDIYVAHYSRLGVDIEEIKKSVVVKDGFSVPALEVLFLMKLFAWHNRRGSAKGQKDELDVLSLAFLPEFGWKRYLQLVEQFNYLEYHREFMTLLKSVHNIKELGIGNQVMAKLRKRILIVIGE